MHSRSPTTTHTSTCFLSFTISRHTQRKNSRSSSQQFENQQRKLPSRLLVFQQRHTEPLLIIESIQHGIGDFLRKEAVHHLSLVMLVHLGHQRIITLEPLGDTLSVVELILVTHLSSEDVVEPVDDLGQALLLRVVGLA